MVPNNKQHKEQQEIRNFQKLREELLLATPNTQNLFAHFFNEGAKTGSEHCGPSPKTMEELTNIKVEQAEIKGDIKNINTNVSIIKEVVEKHVEKEDTVTDKFEAMITKFVDGADDVYVKKEAVKYIYWTVGVVGTLALGLITFFEFFINHISVK